MTDHSIHTVKLRDLHRLYLYSYSSIQRDSVVDRAWTHTHTHTHTFSEMHYSVWRLQYCMMIWWCPTSSDNQYHYHSTQIVWTRTYTVLYYITNLSRVYSIQEQVRVLCVQLIIWIYLIKVIELYVLTVYVHVLVYMFYVCMYVCMYDCNISCHI